MSSPSPPTYLPSSCPPHGIILLTSNVAPPARQGIASTWGPSEPRSFASSNGELTLSVSRTIPSRCNASTVLSFGTPDGVSITMRESALCAVNGALSGPLGLNAASALSAARIAGVPYEADQLALLNGTTDVSMASYQLDMHTASTPGYSNRTATRTLSLLTSFSGLSSSPPSSRRMSEDAPFQEPSDAAAVELEMTLPMRQPSPWITLDVRTLALAGGRMQLSFFLFAS